MKINIIYEINNREFINCVLLERELVRRGHKVTIYNKQETIILGKSADITIIPNSYRTEDVDYYRYVFNTNNNLIIVYPCEQVTNHTLPNFFDYSENNKVKYLPHFCWGKDYYDFIDSLGFDMTYSKVVGAVQLDLCRGEFIGLYHNKKSFAQKYKLPFEKKWILFISDFVYSSELRAKRSIESGEMEAEEILERQNFEKKTRSELIKWFKKFLDTHDDYIIIYRKHPVEMLTSEIEDFANINTGKFYTISDYSIKEWIFSADYITSWDSTSVVECIAAGKRMALLRPYDFSRQGELHEYAFYRKYTKVRTYEQFVDSMTANIAEYNEDTLNEVKKLYSIDKRLAVKRIADAIEDIYPKWVTNREKNDSSFFFARWIYMIKKKLPIKFLVKKIYRFMYITFKFDLANQGESRLAVLEWNASANNKKQYKALSKQIDRILEIYND